MNNLIHSVFEKEVSRVPHAIAIEEEDYSISYDRLNSTSSELASLLISLGIEKGSAIAAFLPSGISLVKALLAIFKSGNVYLPVDVSFSKKRISQIFHQCSANVVVTNSEYKDIVISILKELDIKVNYLIVVDRHVEVRLFDALNNNFTPISVDQSIHKNGTLSIDIQPTDSNYIFYTSGSTGEAKGIVGKHESLSHFIHWEIKEFSLDESIRVSQLTHITFDASLRDIFVPLCVGGTLCIPSSETKTNVVKLIEWIETSKVSLIHCVPSLFRIITKEIKSITREEPLFANLKYLLLAGEALYTKDIRTWRGLTEDHIELVNLYGATETTLIKTFYRIKDIAEDLTQVIPVGKPIDNTSVAIINDDHICRSGEIGELYIKTPFWSKGYINNSEIMVSPFVQNPLVKDREDIVYKTGDLGRYLSDRSIEIIGRVDNQIKVNGIRVELNEVERAILNIEGITQTIVVASKTPDYIIELICYYTGDTLGADFILAQLKQELNENLIPSYFLWLEEFPLNINGKIDKKALPKPEEILEKEFEYEEPVGLTEEKLEEIWKVVLRIDKVGRKITFFQLGASSLKVIEAISRIYKEFNTLITIGDVFSNPTIEEIAAIIEKSSRSAYLDIPNVAVSSDYRVSHAQKRLWILHELDKSSVAYNMPGGFSFSGLLNQEALQQAFITLIERHEILRTTFIVREGEPRQKVHAAGSFRFAIAYDDLRSCSDQEARSKMISYEESTRAFDLSTGPLLRGRLLQTGAEHYIFLFTMHHIISDAWSMEVLVREVLTLYNSYSAGLANPLKPLRIQYKDYSAWQDAELSGEKFIAAQQYWWSLFKDSIPKLELPTDSPRPSVKTYNGNYQHVQLSKEDTLGLNQLSIAQGGTLFMTLVSVVNVLLYKYTGQGDIVVGSPIAGRAHQDLEDQIGIYLNNLSLRSRFRGEDRFSDLLTQVKENTLEAYRHQHYPFDRLVDDLDVERDMSRSPLFDVVVVLQNVDLGRASRPSSVEGSGIDTGFRSSLVDLRIVFHESDGHLHMTIEYNTDLFKVSRITRMLGHYQELVKNIIQDKNQRIDALGYLCADEQTDLSGFTNTSSPTESVWNTLQELVEVQVLRQGDKIAVESGSHRLSYKELNERSNRLAHHLRDHHGIGRESKVGLLADRSDGLIIGLLGILKSGGCYVPIDPIYPRDRRDYLLQDSGVSLLLTESDKLFNLEGYTGSLFALDIELEGLTSSSSNPVQINASSDLAYMIYTSGSTGHPKGVLIEHSGAVNMVLSQIAMFGIVETDKVLQFASSSFDASVSEIFMGLGSGGCVVMLEESKQKDPLSFRDYLVEKSISVATLPPSYLRVLDKSSVSCLRVLITAGEPANVGDALGLQDQLSYYNAYGPTECSVCVSIHKVTLEDESYPSIPIGSPIWNTELYVLDSARSLVGIGIDGELYVSGVGLARGYHKRDDLTEESFVPHPYKPGVRLYRTGDICRWTESGELLYKGRRDHQFKIRGYRIEAGEIECVLKGYPGIREAVVEGVEDGSGEKVLVGYLVTESGLEESSVRTYLQGVLPGYMIPAYIIMLDHLPLTVQGKIDRMSLPRPGDMGMGSRVYVSPRTRTEELLSVIWEEVLGRKPIGIEDNFFEIGGQSLKAIQIVSRIHKELDKQVELRSIFSYPTIQLLSEYLESIKANTYLDIPNVAVSSDYRVSHAQKRLWILHELDKSSVAYNMPGGFSFSGLLNQEALQQAFITLIERHEILRTTFIVREGEPRQKVHAAGSFRFAIAYDDLRSCSDQEARSKMISYEESTRAFDLSTGPLLRGRLLQTGAEHYIFLFTMHHIISDAWSMEVLVREVLTLYNSYSAGLANPLKPLRIQYKDYSAWQDAELSGEKFIAAQQYWWSLFKDSIPKLELPTDSPRPSVKTYNGNYQHVQLSKEDTLGLNQLSIAQGGTLFMTLVSVVNVLLYKYTGQGDIVVGSPIAGRAHQDLEDQIGIYLNNLSLRSRFRGEDRFSDLLTQVKENTLEAYRHQHYPFDRLVDDLDVERDMSRSPLFDVVVVLQNVDLGRASRPSSVEGSGIDTGFRSSLVDLRIVFHESDGHLHMTIEYNTDLFKVSRITRMLGHYQELVKNIIQDKNQRIDALGYLCADEQTDLSGFTNTSSPTESVWNTLQELVEVQVLRQGDKIAVESGSHRLSYKELNERSNRLAHHLRDHHGIGRESKVGLLADRSDGLIIGLLGILKSGGCYVPIDPIYPRDRRDYLLQDSGVSLLLTESDKLFNLEGYTGSLFALDIELEGLTSSSSNPVQINASSDLAYMIYTSGSTGHPKGVLIEHSGAVNMVLSQIAMFGIVETDKVLQFASSSFDASVSEIFMGLGSGGCVVMLEESKQKDPLSFRDYLVEKSISVATLPPSYLRVLDKSSVSCLRVLITAGEPANVGDALGLQDQLSYYNAYGPTECSVCVSIHKVTLEDESYPSIPIGSPIWNTELYVLDSARSLVGIGIDGELYVSGVGLARGYHKRDDLTEESFVPHPYKPGVRLYRTGDICRWTESGELLYKGRRDHQFKIRGYRIEAGEIECVLKGYPGIREAVVEGVEDGSGEKVLVGYLVTESGLEESSVRTYLQGVLPGYMIPAYIIMLDHLPLTVQGKIDRMSLPRPGDMGMGSRVYVSPRTRTEELLSVIWEEVLGRKPIGIEDNFFEIGGQSLKAIQIVSRIHKELDKQVELRSIFSYPTIQLLSEYLESIKANTYLDIPNVAVSSDYRVSHAQKRLWILHELDKSSVAYNMPGGFSFSGLLNQEALQQAFITLIERHEILRTTFIVREGEPRQKVHAAGSFRFAIAYDDLRSCSDQEARSKMISYEESTRAFDLSTGPLLRGRLLQTGAEHYIFLFTMHHIISDAWSMEVLVREVLTLYNSYSAGLANPLKPLRIQYKDYSAWQEFISEQESTDHKAYWLNEFSGEMPVLDMFTDRPRPALQSFNGDTIRFQLAVDRTKALSEISRLNGASSFMILLSIVKILLHKYTSQTDLIIGTPITGRNHKELENQLGLYINTLAIRSQIVEEESFDSFLTNVKNKCLDSFAHQAYPFDKLVDDLNLTRDLSRNPLFDVMMIFQDFESENEKVIDSSDPGNLTIASATISKFDLTFYFSQRNSELGVSIEYNTDLFNSASIERMGSHLRNVIDSVIKDPLINIHKIVYISKEEEEALSKWGRTIVADVEERALQILFEEKVNENGEREALVFEGKKLTYAELNEKSNQLANYVRDNFSIQPDTAIGILLDRSEWMVIGLLGIIKAGAAYVPIDPNFPDERIHYIIEDSGTTLIITENKYFEKTNVPMLDIRNEKLLLASKANPGIHYLPEDLLYVIYTSGTTGNPKGVRISNKSVVNFLRSMQDKPGISAEDSVLALTTYSFDISVLEIFLPLITGAKIIVAPSPAQSDPHILQAIVERERPTIMQATPTSWRMLTDDGWTGSSNIKILCGGEQLPKNLGQKLLRCSSSLWNLYGPTETTVWVTAQHITSENHFSLIGRPINNTSLSIMDKYNRLVPVGVLGELCIGGIGLAKGYHNKTELTKERFIVNPYRPEETLYKTGDICRWLADESIEFFGRNDHQVKIRGHRIELGEIEQMLMHYEGVREAVVLVRIINEEKHLVAYMISDVEWAEQDIRIYLTRKLPAYMVPSQFILMESFPLTLNGKIDRKSFPSIRNKTGTEIITASTPIEQKLLTIWKAVLGRESIGVNENFFEIGGQSLKAVQVVSRIYKELGMKVELKDLFVNSTILGLSTILEQQKQITYLDIPNVAVSGDYRVSHAQKRLWILHELDKSSVAYNMPGGFSFSGLLNQEALQQAFITLIERHEILRTTFIVREGEPRQKVHAAGSFRFAIAYDDLRSCSDQEARSKMISYEESTRAFDLSTGPLLRGRLLQTGAEHYIFLFTMHHIISDAWSMEVLVREVLTLYNSYSAGLANPLKPLRIQYKDYSAWQDAELSGEKFIAAQQYWWSLFKDSIPKLELPTDSPRPSVKTYNGNYQHVQLSKEDTLGLNQLSIAQGGTLFMTLVSVVNVLLYKYTGQGDIVVGSPIAGRAHQDLEDQIGIYLNNLSLRSRFRGEDRFSDLLTQVKENTLEAYRHQHYPFDRLVDDLDVERDMSRSPLFDVVVVLQNVDLGRASRPSSVEGSGIDTGFRSSLVDLRIVFHESDGHLHMTIEYNTDLFKVSRITRMLGHYQELVKNIIQDKNQRIDALGYLCADEQTDLSGFTNTSSPTESVWNTLQELVEVQVLRQGDKIAVESGSHRLSYKELNERSNRLAHHLRDHHGIGRESKVGLLADRSDGLIIGLLGILKSGGCYVPIDPIYPRDRRDYLLQDSGVSLLLTESDKLFNLEGYTGSLFALDIELEGLTSSSSNPVQINASSDLAYMIYTSGSTGHPKGVLIEHSGAVNMVLSQIAMFGIVETDKVLQFASSSFDASVSEIFMGLGSGGCVVMLEESKQKDPLSFRDYLVEKSISVATLPPSYLRVLDKSSVSCLRVLITAGEPANVGDALGLQDQLSYYNAYGPTECSVCVSIHKVTLEDESYPSIPIGSPIWNTELYVLDSARSLVGIGIDGELYVSGVGLARGYHKRDDLTEESFVPHPYKPGVRLYRTGDICRWTESGELLYKGRRDHQFKIRGYRIEAGEIECVLKGYPGIREAVVEGVEDGSGEKVLVGYLVTESGLEESSVRTYLQGVLPGYMIPAYIIMLDHLPLTVQGKIDRMSLPRPGDMGMGSRVYVSPRTRTEELLSVIWEEVLGRKPIGIEDNFFEIGGQSLKAIQIVSRIHKELDKLIALREIFNYPNLKELAEVIEKNTIERSQILKLADPRGEHPSIFFVPPIIGSATIYKGLAEMIKDKFNPYGLQYSGFDYDEQLDDSIHAIGDKFLSEIMNIQNTGTIYLFGYSMGATVAFQIAKRLEEKGKEVNLILVDRGVDDNAEFNMYDTTQNELDKLFDLHVSNWRKITGVDEIERVKKLFINNIGNLKNYKVTNKIKGDIMTITAKDNHKGPNMKNWSKHTFGKTKHITVSGTHFEILSHENITVMSALLKGLLTKKGETIES